jgi:hypothetical protein
MDAQRDIYAADDEDEDETAAENEAVDICYKQRRDVQAFLRSAASQLKVEKVEPNPASMPGSPMYEAFKKAHDASRCKGIRLVFHGSGKENIERIRLNGLDPTRRAGQAYGAGEYFGTDLQTSLRYCRGGNQMLVFAVLLDPAGITASLGGDSSLPQKRQQQQPPGPAAARPTYRQAFMSAPAWGRTDLSHDYRTQQSRWISANGEVTNGEGMIDEAKNDVGNGVVVVHKSEHQLPLFVITFDQNAAADYGGFDTLSGQGMKLGIEELPLPAAAPEEMPPASSRVGPTSPSPAPAPAPTPVPAMPPAPALAPGLGVATAVTSPTACKGPKQQRVFKRGDTGSTLSLPGGNVHDRHGQAGNRTDICASEREANLEASRKRYKDEQRRKLAERKVIDEEKRKVAEQRAEFAARQGKAQTSVATSPSLFPKQQEVLQKVDYNAKKLGSRTRTLREQRKAREAALQSYESPEGTNESSYESPEGTGWATETSAKKRTAGFTGFHVDGNGNLTDESGGIEY